MPKLGGTLRRDYTDQERDLALQAYIRCSGHRDRAHELLKKTGITIPAKTIYDWATKHDTDRLARIRQELEPRIREEMGDMHQALATAAGEIEAKAISRLNEKLDKDEVEAKDLSAAMQRAAIATGIHGEKHLLYTDRPTQIVARKLPDVLRGLKSKGLDVDLPAAEVTEQPV